MTLPAPQQIFALLKDLWEKIDHATPDPEIIESFKFYVARSPAAKFHLALISEMEIDLANPRPRLSDDREWFHMFRDPFAQSLTGLNGRMEVFNRGAKPVPEIEYVYALTLFYLEKVQTVPFRRMFNIKVEDKNGFADFLNELESATCLIRQLLPAALEETGGTMQSFENHYARLEASPPRNAKKLPGRYMLKKPSEFNENPAP